MNRSVVMATVISMFAMGCGSAGTGDDLNTVGFSGPVNVRLDKFKDGDVRNGAFDSDKDINTESGNPYGGFLRDARASLGRDPAAVLIDPWGRAYVYELSPDGSQYIVRTLGADGKLGGRGADSDFSSEQLPQPEGFEPDWSDDDGMDRDDEGDGGEE